MRMQWHQGAKKSCQAGNKKDSVFYYGRKGKKGNKPTCNKTPCKIGNDAQANGLGIFLLINDCGKLFLI